MKLNDPALFINTVQVVVYGGGVRVVLGDSPDGVDENATTQGSFYMSDATAGMLCAMLSKYLGAKYANQDAGTKNGQGIGAQPIPDAGR